MLFANALLGCKPYVLAIIQENFPSEWRGFDYDYKLGRNSRIVRKNDGGTKIVTVPQSNKFSNFTNDDVFKGFEDNYYVFKNYFENDDDDIKFYDKFYEWFNF